MTLFVGIIILTAPYVAWPLYFIRKNITKINLKHSYYDFIALILFTGVFWCIHVQDESVNNFDSYFMVCCLSIEVLSNMQYVSDLYFLLHFSDCIPLHCIPWFYLLQKQAVAYFTFHHGAESFVLVKPLVHYYHILFLQGLINGQYGSWYHHTQEKVS